MREGGGGMDGGWGGGRVSSAQHSAKQAKFIMILFFYFDWTGIEQLPNV